MMWLSSNFSAHLNNFYFLTPQCYELNLFQLVTWGVTNRDVFLLATIRYVVSWLTLKTNLVRFRMLTWLGLTWDIGGSCRSSCNFNASTEKSLALNITVSLVIRLQVTGWPQWMAFKTPDKIESKNGFYFWYFVVITKRNVF